MPSNPQCTFSPTALKHYLHLPTVTTNHLKSLLIVTSTGVEISFPSLPHYATTKLLDYHHFNIVRPHHTPVIRLPTASSATTEARLNRQVLHQRFCHGCDEVLDIMCRQQSILGLPKRAFLARSCPCIICTTTKMTHPPKSKVSTYKLTRQGQLIQIDISFWNVTSIRGFSSLLSVIDGKDRMLWMFPTANKRPPLELLEFVFTMLQREGITILCVHVDEDGALANSSEFAAFLTKHSITMETRGVMLPFLMARLNVPTVPLPIWFELCS
jgi:hypothetical protein